MRVCVDEDMTVHNVQSHDLWSTPFVACFWCYTTTLHLDYEFIAGINVSLFLLLLPVVHLRDTPRKLLVVTGDSARLQKETTESSARFFNSTTQFQT